MKVRLKQLADQVIVITGASSGIGLVTARRAARAGAKLVLAARSEDALRQLAEQINAAGGPGRAVYVVADVGNDVDVRRIADAAIEHFGRFDTWVNDAGVSIYGRVEEVSLEDHLRLFETNFWGVVHGSRIAAEHLRRTGGALINIGSVLSDRAIPLQGMYCASKHAVKGFTDALRMELEEQGAPVSVTLVKPSAIDTPYTRHAKNYMDEEPQNPPPVYAPETVAEAILHCATHPERDVTVGGGGKVIAAAGTYAPRLMDRVMEWVMFDQQKTGRPKRRGSNGSGLHHGSNDLSERGDYRGHVMESSLFTKASTHPLATAATLVGAGVAMAVLWHAARDARDAREPAAAWKRRWRELSPW